MIVCRFLIGCWLNSDISKGCLEVPNTWYWFFDFLILKSTSGIPEASDTAEFLLLNILENAWVGLGDHFLASQFLFAAATSSSSY